MQETSHVDFTRALALQLIHPRDLDDKPRQCRARRRRKVHHSKSRRSADGSADSDGSEGVAREHQLASLFSLTGKAHLQRAFVQCKPTFRKASCYCKSCGPEFVICGPTTGCLCYQHHVQGRYEQGDIHIYEPFIIEHEQYLGLLLISNHHSCFNFCVTPCSYVCMSAGFLISSNFAGMLKGTALCALLQFSLIHF